MKRKLIDVPIQYESIIKTAFITRTKSINDFKERDFKRLIKAVRDSGIKNRYVLSDIDKDNYLVPDTDLTVTVIKDKNPTSAISLNKALQRIREDDVNPKAFLISSQEVILTDDHINRLIKVLNDDPTLLVAGYKFTIKDEELNSELQWYYARKKLIAFKVPWNTCALWNYKLFDKYVEEFDEITTKNPFNPVCVCIDNVCSQTEHVGMEDGLAIAKALTQNERLKYKLISADPPLCWKVNVDRINEHRKKLARKDTVMRDFMEVKKYSIDKSRNARME
ncbi:MAG TPA: hypothetical protein VMR81_07890 [Patescibacteria group bacterium]|jgi:hypothetical protein|nr:hypothetical protein [Patescibacteria group bacterium]